MNTGTHCRQTAIAGYNSKLCLSAYYTSVGVQVLAWLRDQSPTSQPVIIALSFNQEKMEKPQLDT